MADLEAGVVLTWYDRMELHWHIPKDRTIGYLPDSQDLWHTFWVHRERITGFAHTHPGSGVPSPSQEDLTTFEAIEAGLGKRLAWFIASRDVIVKGQWVGPGKLDYEFERVSEEIYYRWIDALRRQSYNNEGESRGNIRG
jgi:hypothetical protein